MAGTDGQSWKVGQLARLTGLTVRTLHHYDQVGLLSPLARTPSGHRLYGEPDVHRLYRIVALRELGLPLEVIGDLLTGERTLLICCDNTWRTSISSWQQYGGPSPVMIDYIRRANAVSST